MTRGMKRREEEKEEEEEREVGEEYLKQESRIIVQNLLRNFDGNESFSLLLYLDLSHCFEACCVEASKCSPLCPVFFGKY